MLLSITGKLDTQKLSSALSQVTNWHKLGIKLGIPPAEIKENSRPSFSSFLPPSLLPSLPCALPSLFLSQLTKSEDVAHNCRSRCERQGIPYYRFSPELDEIISTIEDDDEKLCDIILKAKMLLEGSQAQMDTLIQHFYYTAAHENKQH